MIHNLNSCKWLCNSSPGLNVSWSTRKGRPSELLAVPLSGTYHKVVVFNLNIQLLDRVKDHQGHERVSRASPGPANTDYFHNSDAIENTWKWGCKWRRSRQSATQPKEKKNTIPSVARKDRIPAAARRELVLRKKANRIQCQQYGNITPSSTPIANPSKPGSGTVNEASD
ncbi:hypothetical protein C8R44DRAFT_855039 [Mycena epipterygia]|nr:hypothetical protein C8R44DRAFT_855039 [Mycena epipterygia]